MTEYLTLDDLIEIAYAVVGEVLVRDAGLLESAAARPAISVFGKDAYPSVFDKAAALMESLARNHALVDGNKRLAWTATVIFCEWNGIDIVPPTTDEAVDLVLDVVAGAQSRDQVAATLLVWAQPMT